MHSKLACQRYLLALRLHRKVVLRICTADGGWTDRQLVILGKSHWQPAPTEHHRTLRRERDRIALSNIRLCYAMRCNAMLLVCYVMWYMLGCSSNGMWVGIARSSSVSVSVSEDTRRYEYCRKSKETPDRQPKCPWIFHRGPDRMASCSSMWTSGTIDALWNLRMGTVQRIYSSSPLTGNLERDKEANGWRGEGSRNTKCETLIDQPQFGERWLKIIGCWRPNMEPTWSDWYSRLLTSSNRHQIWNVPVTVPQSWADASGLDTFSFTICSVGTVLCWIPNPLHYPVDFHVSRTNF